MRILPRLVTRRFKRLGLLSDVAMVGAAALRVTQGREGRSRSNSPAETLMVAGAAWRLLRRIRRVRKNRRLAKAE